MDENKATLEQFRTLFALAEKVKQLAPWEWMVEEDLFGVEDPQTGEWGFVSVLGEAGEFMAVNICRDSQGLYQYLDFMIEGEMANPFELLQIPMLQLSITDKASLEEHELELIKQLKLKFKKRHGWVSFRSQKEGFLPWTLEADEISLMQCGLEQLLQVAPRAQTDKSFLFPEYPVEDDVEDAPVHLFMRVPRKEGENIIWEDAVREIPLPEEPKINTFLDPQHLDGVKKLPKYRNPIELDVVFLPMPSDEDSHRPYFPLILLAVDAREGNVLFSHLLRPLPSVQAMYESIPLKLLTSFMEMGHLPRTLHIRSPIMEMLVKPITSPLQIKLEPQEALPAAEAASMNMLQFIMQDELDFFGEEDDDEFFFLPFDDRK